MTPTFPEAFLRILLGSILLVPTPRGIPQAPGPEVGAVEDVSLILRTIREKHDLPGLAAVVIQGDRIVASGADGVRRRGSDAKITVRDRFHLGSCTKSMTATLVATLVEDGKLRWETTLGEVYADLGDGIRPTWRAVTLEQLLTHRSGAPGDLEEGRWPGLWEREGTPTEHRLQLVKAILAREPESPPGTKFVYSNAGFAIAGAMAEKVTGETWEDLMRGRLFRRLGMESAGFGAPGKAGALDEPLGHTEDGQPVEVGPGDDNPPVIGPAGTVHATLGDWAKYVAVHLDGEEGVEELLEAETFAQLHEPAGGAGPKYAMGWVVRDGGATLWHNGSNTLWYCEVTLQPGKHFAVLVATNQGGPKATKACDEAASALNAVRSDR